MKQEFAKKIYDRVTMTVHMSNVWFDPYSISNYRLVGPYKRS